MLALALVEIRNTLLLCIFMSVAIAKPAFSMIIDNNKFGGVIDITENTIITDSTIIDVANINAGDGWRLENNGFIKATINVCDNCTFYIENSGDIQASFNLGDGAKIVQVINSSDDITPLGIGNGYNVLINGADNISWRKVMSISGGAETIILRNSELVLTNDNRNVLRTASVGPEIELVGDVIVRLDSVNNLDNVPILSNIHGDGAVHVYSDNLDIMHAIHSYIKNESLYVELVRETDYAKILRNKTGDFLNGLRKENPNDSLLAVLDTAETLDDLHSVMRRSARLNPIRLMDSIRSLTLFQMTGMYDSYVGMNIMPMTIFSDVFNLSGADINGRFEISDSVSFAFSVYGAGLRYSDDINNYSGAVYGGNLRIEYNNSFGFARALVGTSFAHFDIGDVFNGTDVKHNPDGLSLYAATDIGTNFNISDAFSVSPFIRMGVDYAMIANVSDTDFICGMGTDLIFDVDGYDIKYNYAVRFGADVRGMLDASVRINAWSVADGAGGALNIGTIYDNGSISYKIGLEFGCVF